ncbi:MAG: ribosome biogenesis GTPase Der [Gammaproteobacteria bacterium]|jgi:GTP-binding protein|nr:ribosome biogenesis GTPase Der [Gammaproteobacteria bacterium]
MLPVIVLVGRPNVGKSTLFNRLTRSRDALVADFPGLTRDRQYGVGRVGPAPYVVVDTGGISGGEGVEMLTEQQVQRAIEDADHLLFLVDAREGSNSIDLEIAEQLRRTGKPLTLVANKVDHVDWETSAAEFHLLGVGDPHPIAATQGRGVKALLDQVFARLPSTAGAAEAETDEDEATGAATKIAVVGRPNAGKSTLINRLLGEDRVVVFDSPGTTRDSISIPFSLGEHHYQLIDTAGMRRRARITEAIEKFSVVKTLQAIEACNVAILVLDAHTGIGDQDATLAAHLVDSGRALVVAVNKWDGLDPTERRQIKEAVARRLPFLDFAEVEFISALHGSGVGLLLETADRAFENATRTLPTPLLTRLLEDAVQEHPPPLVRGRRIKLRYAHQGGRNPPIIVIHGNQTGDLPESYRRYLINRFRKALHLFGTPMRLELKSGENPYAGRRNRLTPRQARKRDRLKRFVKRKR